jgi:hypothetical protein
VYSFDDSRLEKRLGDLSDDSRRLFALTCAERLFPLYRAFNERSGRGDPDPLRKTLDQLWNSLLRGEPWADQSFLEQCDSLIPGEDVRQDQWTGLDAPAENAVIALVRACLCSLEGDPQNAYRAAVQGYEAADYIAQSGMKKFYIYTPDILRRIADSPVVQRELERQERDLAELEAADRGAASLGEMGEAFRLRAVSEGSDLVDSALAVIKPPKKKGETRKGRGKGKGGKKKGQR